MGDGGGGGGHLHLNSGFSSEVDCVVGVNDEVENVTRGH